MDVSDRIGEIFQELRTLDRSSTSGRFHLGDLMDELQRLGLYDADDQVVVELEVDRSELIDAWFVATAFPPDQRREGVDWTTYFILRYHPDRHELVELVAREAWSRERLRDELSARFAARWEQHAVG